MTLKQYMSIMVLATCLCWASWLFVLFQVDPFHDGVLGIVFFYLTLFFSLVGTVSLLIFSFLYFLFRLDRPVFYYVQKTFYIGAICAISMVILLYLQAASILNIWNVGIFVCILLFLMLFNFSVRRSRIKHE